MKLLLVMAIAIIGSSCTLTLQEKRQFAASFCFQRGGRWDMRRHRCIEPKRIRCKKEYGGDVVCTEIL